MDLFIDCTLFERNKKARSCDFLVMLKESVFPIYDEFKEAELGMLFIKLNRLYLQSAFVCSNCFFVL